MRAMDVMTTEVITVDPAGRADTETHVRMSI
jgi:hypothetical protein